MGRYAAGRSLRGAFLLDGEPVLPHVTCARTLLARMRGLLGRRSLPTGEALWLDPCPSIHMVGMQFAIDVIFLDNQLRIVRVVPNVRPMALAMGGKGARSAVEVATGWLPLDRLQPGTPLVWLPKHALVPPTTGQ